MVSENPQDYQDQLEQKVQQIQALFSELEMPELEVFDSPATEYRMRAEFRFWHQGERSFYAMFDPKDRRTPIETTDFPQGSATIRRLMPLLLEQIHLFPEIRRKLFQVEFLTTSTGEALITLIYHRALAEEWQAQAEQIRDALGIQIIGRSKKQKILLNQDYLDETLEVDGKPLVYRQIESSFTQPNARICEKMLSWARSCSEGAKGDLLELYCGNGNFCIALADKYRKALATEISKTSIKAAKYNCEVNGTDNLTFVRMSSEDFTQAMNGVRPFTRLKDTPLDQYDFQTILVDPPRAGLDADTVQMISQFENIIYISCNPLTLKDNLQALGETHSVERLALFDQFPWTHHVESGVLLRKKA